MRSDAYWAARAVRRMHEYQKQADKTADDIAQVYIKTTNYINNEIRKIFNAFQLDNGLSEAEARRILNHLPDSETLNSIRSVISGIADPAHWQELLSLLNAPAYAHRIQRLEQLQADIDRQAEQLGSFEQSVTQKRYMELADEAYNRTIFDLQKGTGIGFSFLRMPRSRIEEVLRNNWSGKLFSERIWGRSEEINRRLKEELLTGFMTGRSYRKTAQAIEECMEVGAMEARRLVRTESTYVANMAEAESYKECGIERYKFVATLDMRTSAVCQALDGETFPVSEAVPGTNMPPMHPWCRSTTIAVIDDAVTEGWTRIARDPETGKTYRVPADMTYAEWKNSLTTGVEGGRITIGAKSAVRNTGKALKYNQNASFRVEIPEYSAEINAGISRACKEVAELGGMDGNEHLCLVDLKTGNTVFREDGNEVNVGGKSFWEFISQNKDKQFSFVHNHNTDGYFSETDMSTLLLTPNIKGFTAVRIDGVIYHTIKETDIVGKRLDEIFSDEIEKINALSREGKITAGERTRLREEIIVDGAIREFTKGLIEFE